MTQTQVSRAESLDEQDPHKSQDGDKKPKSRRPASMRIEPLSSCSPSPLLPAQTNMESHLLILILLMATRYRISPATSQGLAVSSLPSGRPSLLFFCATTIADISPSYRPILTPKTVLPLFFAIGVIFAPIGGLLLWASSQVRTLFFKHLHFHSPVSNMG